jgi:quercetin dioxygenase-like cupin family protein
MKPVIKNFEGAGNPLLGPGDGVPNYVMLYVRHAPGESSPDHTHPWEHQAFITEGSGILWVDGAEYPIKQGDAVLVPPGSRHYFKNTGSVMLSRVTVNPLSSVEGG